MSEAVKIIIKALRSYLQLKQFRFNKENVLLNLNAPLAPQHFMLMMVRIFSLPSLSSLKIFI